MGLGSGVRFGWSAVSAKREPSSHVSVSVRGAVRVHSSSSGTYAITDIYDPVRSTHWVPPGGGRCP